MLVDGKIAELKADSTFRYKAALKPGLNTVEIIALTADGRTHESVLNSSSKATRRRWKAKAPAMR